MAYMRQAVRMVIIQAMPAHQMRMTRISAQYCMLQRHASGDLARIA